MPEVEQVRAELEPQGVAFLALSLDDDAEAVEAAAKRLGLRMPVATAAGEVLGPNGLRGVPAMLFVDGRGVVVDAAQGRLGREALAKRARALLSP